LKAKLLIGSENLVGAKTARIVGADQMNMKFGTGRHLPVQRVAPAG